MSIGAFLSAQASDRRGIMTAIHSLIVETDGTVKARVSTMMGKEMIVYEEGPIFKYGLAGGKQHMSLHIMPIYGSPALHDRYSKLLDKAKFKKGCINFKSAEEMLLALVKSLLQDSAKINLRSIMEKAGRKNSFPKKQLINH